MILLRLTPVTIALGVLPAVVSFALASAHVQVQCCVATPKGDAQAGALA